MEASKHETIILINDAEAKEGYFRFSTSKLASYTRLLKRIGGEAKLLDLQTQSDGRTIVGWQCRVPIEFLSKRSWAIRPKSTVKRGFNLKKVA